MKWLKLLIAAAAIVVVAGALLWGADLNQGQVAQARSTPRSNLADLIGERAGLSGSTVRRIESAYLGVAADQAQAAGSITPEQANRLRQLAFSPVLDNIFDSFAQSAGASDSELFNGLIEKQSLAQIAEAHGVSRETLKSRLKSAIEIALAGQQITGLLTSSQGAVVLGTLDSNLDQLIDAKAQ